MAQMLLINPAKRGKRKMAARKKPRTAAQKAATKRMIAANRKRRVGTSTTKKSTRTGKTPTKRLATRRKANTVRGYYPNPVKRRTVRRRVKRNPSPRGLIKNMMKNQIQPAMVQATGAIGMDIMYGYIGAYIPAMLNTGMMKHLTKSVLALGASAVAAMVVKQSTAETLARGALTVVFHDAMKEGVAQFAPSVPLGYYSPAYSPSLSYYEAKGLETNPMTTDTGIGYYEPTGEAFDSSGNW